MTQSTPSTLTQRSVVGPGGCDAAAQQHRGRRAPRAGSLRVRLALRLLGGGAARDHVGQAHADGGAVGAARVGGGVHRHHLAAARSREHDAERDQDGGQAGDGRARLGDSSPSGTDPAIGIRRPSGRAARGRAYAGWMSAEPLALRARSDRRRARRVGGARAHPSPPRAGRRGTARRRRRRRGRARARRTLRRDDRPHGARSRLPAGVVDAVRARLEGRGDEPHRRRRHGRTARRRSSSRSPHRRPRPSRCSRASPTDCARRSLGSRPAPASSAATCRRHRCSRSQ